jgi:hypothetical protein
LGIGSGIGGGAGAGVGFGPGMAINLGEIMFNFCLIILFQLK